MQLTLIKNTDTSASLAYRIARTVHEQTGASSLQVVEAMTSMIKNISDKYQRDILDVVSDNTLFPSVKTDCVPASSRSFQMCLRVAQRMLCGGLPDMCCGATRFHHADVIPDWAIARGYIADIDGILFYL